MENKRDETRSCFQEFTLEKRKHMCIKITIQFKGEYAQCYACRYQEITSNNLHNNCILSTNCEPGTVLQPEEKEWTRKTGSLSSWGQLLTHEKGSTVQFQLTAVPNRKQGGVILSSGGADGGQLRSLTSLISELRPEARQQGSFEKTFWKGVLHWEKSKCQEPVGLRL